MKVVPLKSIIVPDNRQRRTFDEKALRELADSIKSKGLMHPPVVRDDGRTLVAGERRLRALRLLVEDGYFPDDVEIPVTVLSELSDLEIQEAELEENTIRVDLTWQEMAAARADLQKLREAQHGKYNPATQTGWSVKDTVKELLGETVDSGYQVTKFVEDITLAKHLDDPEIAAAKTRKEATKILRKKKEAEHNAALAKKYENTTWTKHTILQGSAFDILPTLSADEPFQVIVTDPPYGVDANSFGSMAGAAHEYEDSEEFALSCYELVAKEGYRLTTPSAQLYAFCDILLFPKLKEIFLAADWFVFPTPLIWNKSPGGMLPLPEKGPRRNYEAILYAYRFSTVVTGVFSDVISIPGLANPKFGAQKPPVVYQNLIQRAVRPGDRVLDMFAGAGPALHAAEALTCTATLIELNQEKVDFIKASLAGAPQPVESTSALEGLFNAEA